MAQERERPRSDEPVRTNYDDYARQAPPRGGEPPRLPAAEASGVEAKATRAAGRSWLGVKREDWIAGALLLAGAAVADGAMSVAFGGPFPLLFPLFAVGLGVATGWRWLRDSTRIGSLLTAAERSGDRAAVDMLTGALMVLFGLGLWWLSLLLGR